MGKYVWVSEDFAKYMNEEAEKLRKKLKNREAGTVMVSKVMMTNIIVPNNIKIADTIQLKKKRISKKSINRLLI